MHATHQSPRKSSRQAPLSARLGRQTAHQDEPVERSNRADVRNPLVALATAQDLMLAPARERWLIARALASYHTECSARAQALWAANQPSEAATFKAAAVYAGHIRRLALAHKLPHANVNGGLPPALALVRSTRAETTPATVRDQRLARNRLRTVAALSQIQALSAPARALLCALLADLSVHARTCADESWAKHKAPMAAYHAAVSAHARRTAHLLRNPSTSNKGLPTNANHS